MALNINDDRTNRPACGRVEDRAAAEVVRDIIDRARARGSRDDRVPEAILGYDHDGLPR